MAALTVTVAEVLGDYTGDIYTGIAGATITAGQSVYLDSTTSTVKLADADASAAAAAAIGIALHAALAGQPIRVQRTGDVTIGATAAMTVGTIYVVAATAGGIAPAADAEAASTWYVTPLGVAITAAKLRMPGSGPLVSGVINP